MHKVSHDPQAEQALLSVAYGGRLAERRAPQEPHARGQHLPRRRSAVRSTTSCCWTAARRLNLATFVTTWMEPQAQTLMVEAFDKNMIDKDEYPATAEIERRCVNIVADLFHAQPHETAVGVSTIGSSEAVMLAGLALKWRWRERRRAAGLSTDRPNLVLGSNVQVVWEKFCRYWDVEARYVPITRERYTITPETVLPFVDENTIGVVAILGTTFTGRVRADQGDRRGADRSATTRPAGTCPCTWTPPAAASSPRSCSPTWSGTSGCRSSSPSTSRGTSTG